MSNELEENKLWRACDENGKRFFTQYSNCIIQGVVSGKFKPIESRMILYIGRWTDGFRRDESNKYLSTEDFMKEIGISVPQFSTTMRKLLKDRIVFRGKRIGNSYKYAINLLPYGIHMKHYKIVEAGYKLSNEEYTFDNKSYSFCNSSDVVGNEIVYKSSGFDKEEKLHIKQDINTYTKLDTKDDSKSDDASASSLGAPSAEASNNSSTVTSPVGVTPTSAPTMGASNNVQQNKLLGEFREAILNNYHSLSIPLMVEYMQLFEGFGLNRGSIFLEWCAICKNHKTNKLGELLDIENYKQAVKIYNGVPVNVD